MTIIVQIITVIVMKILLSLGTQLQVSICQIQ